MSITGLEGVSSAANPISSPGSDFLGKDAFLYMFISQLRAQDPLNPMESTEFTAQLAQFSSLEQLNNVNANLEFLQLYQASINNSQAVSFIGKTINAFGNSTGVIDGVADQIHFELAHDANDVLVHIYDSDGNLVKTIESGTLNAGEQAVEWDGTDNEGNEVTDGTYTFEVVATDTEGNPITATTFITALVNGVSFKDGTTYLLAGDQEIPIGSVFKVMEA
ncbi:MAG: flagellar hook assembly protein FlgD [Desulfobacteraceae bacterium]|nr:MAG: flagellar hook assembly protein FlgD [Desulfobacteraceae bacterium]